MELGLHASRQSGIELLRLVSMLMILILHANYLSFGQPIGADYICSPISSIIRSSVQQLCVVAVNIFILISGWFSIRPNIKSIFRLCSQVLFYSFVVLFFIRKINEESLGISDLYSIFVVGKGYWFVTSYLLLYILSPILNTFIVNCEKRQFFICVFFFFLYEFLYGWLFNEEHFYEGYSTISFVGLYLLAGFTRRFYLEYIEKLNKYLFLLSYLLLTLFPIIIMYFSYTYKLEEYGDHIAFKNISYNSPFVVFASFMLFLFFERLSIQSKLINYLSSSALSIYLIHCNPYLLYNYYIKTIKYIVLRVDSQVEGIFNVALFIVVVFWGCLVIDKIRIGICNSVRILGLILYRKLKC